MKTYLECIPCFLNQTLTIMNQNNVDYKIREKVIKNILVKLSKINLNSRPPEFALFVHKIIEDNIDNSDFYTRIKRNDNFAAAELIPKINKMLKNSKDSLYNLVKIAISGNIMDFAANPKYDIIKTIKKSRHSRFAINHYENFKKDVQNAKSIAYFADNAGEITFDKLLIEEIIKVSKASITLFVRSRPVANDVTEEDARFIGLDKLPKVKIQRIKTVFPFITKNLTSALIKYDMIISKGQANYECLSELKINIYFLLIAKCEVIARNMGVKQHSFVLMGGNKNE